MDFPQISVSVRPLKGKGPARRLRMSGQTPAVLYGSGVNSLCLSVSPTDLTKVLSGPLHTNTVLTLSIDGETGQDLKGCKAMVRDHQFDPVTRQLLHVDFVAVSLDKKLSIRVPLKLEGRSVGEQAGGKLRVVYRTLPIEVLPEKIPPEIVVDITNLQLNETVSVADLSLPEGVEVTLPAETTIILVEAARAEEVAESEEEGTEEAAETATETPAKPGEGEGKNES